MIHSRPDLPPAPLDNAPGPIWVGIDEAGYGPFLGPLVMTSVAAQARGSDAPDLWRDLAGRVDRAGGTPEAVWIDDSKRLMTGPRGRARLERTALAAVAEAAGDRPATLVELCTALGCGGLDQIELEAWLPDLADLALPRWCDAAELDATIATRPLRCSAWRLGPIRCAVVGPGRFNQLLQPVEASDGVNACKSLVHRHAFFQLMREAWDSLAQRGPVAVRSDKHGGRHYYMDMLVRFFEDSWIDRGEESPTRSAYAVRNGHRRLTLELCPRSDRDDGLVALASVVSKYLRELWMDLFNQFWDQRVADLKPTAGYPSDARRFRQAIEAQALALDLAPHLWWRQR